MTSIRYSSVLRALPGVLLIGASACTLTTTARVRTPPPVSIQAQIAVPTVQVQVAAPVLATGVTVVETSCAQGAPEVCNGLDDNCNGQIDEGCGYSSGEIQITMYWNTGADLDLYVTDPSGETISYSHTESASGGRLDHDARGQCNASQQNNTIENVFWSNPNPPSGSYQVEVHYWGECNTNAGPTTATLSISVGGQVVGAYNYTLAPDQRVTVATFQIP
ncbi:MAG: DUF2135 domain-containing protein [Deltaproteobacteria bacterium]|nr:DUF2135 domain-containing protein [Deltaproteobacteria bacterium]